MPLRDVCREIVYYPGSSIGPVAGEDFDGGACHVDAIVILRPVQLEVAAGEVCGGDVFASAGEDGCDEAGTGACSAGEGDAGASLPCSHVEFGGGEDLDEMGVDPLWEEGVVFDGGADAGEVEGGDFIHEEDGVGVAH